MELPQEFDCSSWTPLGTLTQLDYATKAALSGPSTVGIKNEKYVVLVAMGDGDSDLALRTRRILKLSENCAIAYSGVVNHGDKLLDFIRQKQIELEFSYNNELIFQRMASVAAVAVQDRTMFEGRLVHGTSILLAPYENKSGNLYLIMPGGYLTDRLAVCIGGNHDKAEEYLVDNLHRFKNCDKQDLIVHAIRAISRTVDSTTMNRENINIDVAVVGENNPFELLPKEQVLELIDIANNRNATLSNPMI